MKDVFAADIAENDNVESLFLVAGKNLAVGKTGKPYLTISLMDRSGTIEGKVWDDAERLSSYFDADDFVKVKGRASAYMGKLQLKVTNVSRIDDDGVDAADFLPTAARGLDDMFSELMQLIGTLNEPHLKKLLSLMLEDPKIADDFRHAPAAKGMHHVYIGGLLEHSLSLCALIDHVCGHYGKRINRDLLIAGAVLHDIGKTRELSYSRSFNYTDEGRLLGHITIGVEMIDEKLRFIEGFPHELAILVKHMILSHHGEYEYGSPKRPKTLEATILSYLDDLDAKVNSIQSLIDAEIDNGSGWTGYHRLFERFIYKGNFLNNVKVKNEAAEERVPVDKDDQKGKTMTLFE